MLIQVNSDHETRSSADQIAYVQGVVEDKLKRFAERVTRAEVHLNDENTSAKSGGKDKRCQIEVRLAGLSPISVTHHADSHDLALDGAVAKMYSVIETALAKQSSR